MQTTLPTESLGETPSTADRRYTTLEGRPRPKELNHLFVNNVRFLSMFAIIALHVMDAIMLVKGTQWKFSYAIEDLFKFATIGFFLISGFLLGERVDRRNPIDYFLSRLKRVFRPWLVWFGAVAAALILRTVENKNLWHAGTAEILRITAVMVWSLALTSAFWFVPNLLVAIAILLIFRRYLYTLRLGAVLLIANIVYTANVYALWFPSSHTEALLAFVFYLWLGSYAAHHFDRLNNLLTRTPAALLIALASITCLMGYAESYLLHVISNPQPLNTLRISNQLFSICMVALFFKLKRPSWPYFIDVRRHTFGLYLTHCIGLLFLMSFIKSLHLVSSTTHWIADIQAFALWFAATSLTYLACLAITTWLAEKPSLQWMVGLSSQDSERRTVANALKPGAFVQT